MSVIPASIAAFSVRFPCSSGGRPWIDNGMPPKPMTGIVSPVLFSVVLCIPNLPASAGPRRNEQHDAGDDEDREERIEVAHRQRPRAEYDVQHPDRERR